MPSLTKKSPAHKQSTSSTPAHPSAPAASPAVTTPAAAILSTASIALPPPDTIVPAPPQGFVPTNASDYRGLLPKKAELAVLSDALTEFQRFSDFASVFGKTAPPLASVTQTLDAAQQWSSLRAKTFQYDQYCGTQEGLAWKDARTLFATMRAAFNLAVSTDKTIATQFPSITRLLSANSDIAQRGVATKKANKELVAKGEQPTKGKAGRKLKKAAADRAEVLASLPPTPPPATPPAATPVVTNGVATAVTNGAGH